MLALLALVLNVLQVSTGGYDEVITSLFGDLFDDTATNKVEFFSYAKL